MAQAFANIVMFQREIKTLYLLSQTLISQLLHQKEKFALLQAFKETLEKQNLNLRKLEKCCENMN